MQRSDLAICSSRFCRGNWHGGRAVFADPAFSIPAFAKAALTFGLISVLANILSTKSAVTRAGSLSFIPVLASAAIAPHWFTAVVVAAAALAAQLLARRGGLKTVFNVAQQCFAVALAILAYRSLVGMRFDQHRRIGFDCRCLRSSCLFRYQFDLRERRDRQSLTREIRGAIWREEYARRFAIRFPLASGHSLLRLDLHAVQR